MGFESWLERDHAISTDFDPRVRWFAAQPFWLFRTSPEGVRLPHAPDYFARWADGSAGVVDCRPEGRRKPQDLAKFAGTQTRHHRIIRRGTHPSTVLPTSTPATA